MEGSPHAQEQLFNTLQRLHSDDAGLNDLVKSIQMALTGADFSSLGQSLNGVYASIWRQIVEGVKQ